MRVRRARPVDAESIAQFNEAMALETEQKVLDPPCVRAGVSAVLSDDNHGFYLVAEHAGQIAGALMVTYEWSDWRNGQLWWIQSVYVCREFRRQGVYRQLYEKVHELVEQADNVVGVRLYVEQDNQIAQQTYRALGMQATPYRIFEWAR